MKGKELILSKMRESIKSIDPDAEIILFGSRARGDHKTESDWDLLILLNQSSGLKEERKFRHKLFEVELEYGLAISTIVYSKDEWENKHKITPLYQNIQKEGLRI